MTTVEYNILKVNECDILTNTCEICIGDEMTIGCWVKWDDGSPAVDTWVLLRFYNQDKTEYNDAWLGQTDNDGWYGGYHKVTEADLEGLIGKTGYVQLHSHTDPKGWGDTKYVEFPSLYHQLFHVFDQDYNVLEGATVNIPNVGSCITTRFGYCGIDVEKGKTYTATASKTGYECYDSKCSKTFTAPYYDSVPLYLKKVAEYCSQKFKVIDQDGKPVYQAIVNANGNSCYTDPLGECSIDLVKGQRYFAKASKAGYLPSKPYYFIACVPNKITLTIEKYVVECTQEFLVLHPDGTVASNAYVYDELGQYCGPTGSDGKCSLDYIEGTLHTVYAHKFGYKDSDPYTIHSACEDEITLQLKEATCVYTGHAIDAKIDHWQVPKTARVGEKVLGWVKVDGDCWLPRQTTRGRVKFVVEGETAYSDSFLFDCYGETDAIPFSFTMPDHDVTLIAEVQRCNADGKWENAGPNYKKEFFIEKETAWNKALTYAIIAIGAFAGGTIVEEILPKGKAIGSTLKVGALIPAGLCGREVYKILKEKL